MCVGGKLGFGEMVFVLGRILGEGFTNNNQLHSVTNSVETSD
jgi:hypothetical protein